MILIKSHINLKPTLDQPDFITSLNIVFQLEKIV